MNEIKTKEIEKILEENRGTIYSLNDFYHLGNKNTIKSIFYRLEKQNKIFRVMDGLYTKPHFSQLLQENIYPHVEEVADKIAEKFSWKTAPTEEAALNYTGLSTQVPAVLIYVSSGPYREYNYNGIKIIFKHTKSIELIFSEDLLLIIQAIKALGENRITKKDINKLAFFVKKIKLNLNEPHLNKLPYWIFNTINQIKEKICEN